MATVTLHGEPCQTHSELPGIDKIAPDFTLVDGDLFNVHLANFSGKKKLIYVLPSLDTPVCALSTAKLNKLAAERADVAVLVVSADLPFAQARFREAEGVDHITTLSTMRNHDFPRDYGVLLRTGPLAGICARAVIVLDEENRVRYAAFVDEIGDEPDFAPAFAAL